MRILVYSLLLILMGCSSGVLEYPVGKVSTPQGDMYFWLYDETPEHRDMFIRLANEGIYDQFTFNRVIPEFVIQGGCPDSVQYFENSPYLLDPEFVDGIDHHYGALGMGRDDNPEKRSNGCQIYIVNNTGGLPRLNGEYMIFGTMLEGDEVLESISQLHTDDHDKPLTDVPMKVTIEYHTLKAINERWAPAGLKRNTEVQQ